MSPHAPPGAESAGRRLVGGSDQVVGAVVRERHPDDLPPLLDILRRVHEREGYPVRSSAVRAEWLAPPGELLGAVATDGDRVVGHIGLHPAAGPAAALLQWQRATGSEPDGLTVVSRFFTDRSLRGTGTVLLAHAVERADALGRLAVLQVDPDSPARDFYRRRGWQEVGTAVQQWGHRTVDAVLMVAP
jgi:GNAT superfamily N-acetyltransferase